MAEGAMKKEDVRKAGNKDRREEGEEEGGKE